MAIEIFIAVSIGFAATMLFAFQFSVWDNKPLLIGFFLLVAVPEFVAAHFFMPPGAMPPVIGIVFLFIGMAVLTAKEVVAAVDKFRGTATAAEVAAAIGHACWELGHDCVEIAVADGGEGILDALGIFDFQQPKAVL